MNRLFIASLLTTFVIVRITTHLLHNPKTNKKYTLTGKIREKTKLDIHHVHLGIILLLLSMVTNLFYNLTNLLIVCYGISLSLIADQITPLMLKNICYFSKIGILSAIIIHLIIILIFL